MSDSSQSAADWVHRTILNTIRYLLTTSVIDRGALADFSAKPPDDVYLPAALPEVLDECATVIGQIAATGAFDDETRLRLSILDSRLRVRMQVDPQSDGAFAVWAMEIVEGLGQRGCVALVSGINASSDQRAIPGPVRLTVDRVLALAGDSASVRVLTDGVEDYLSLSFSPLVSAELIEAVRSTGLVSGESVTLADCILDLDFGPEAEDTVVTLVTSRPCQFNV
jgi:hypothetical protein